MVAVVFLDIDGVLNSVTWSRTRPRPSSDNFDPSAVARLNRLIEATGAAIVVSSSWRQYGEEWVTKALKNAGVLAPIIGCTPILDDGSTIMRALPRGKEIQAWLDAWPDVETFVILDDEPDMVHLRRRLVRTDQEVGLTDADVDRAIAMLTGSR